MYRVVIQISINRAAAGLASTIIVTAVKSYLVPREELAWCFRPTPVEHKYELLYKCCTSLSWTTLVVRSVTDRHMRNLECPPSLCAVRAAHMQRLEIELYGRAGGCACPWREARARVVSMIRCALADAIDALLYAGGSRAVITVWRPFSRDGTD